MKQILPKILLPLVLALTAIQSSAYSFEVDGIYYYITLNDRVTVTSGNIRYEGNVFIPSQVTYEGATYEVAFIDDYAFNDCKNLTSINIPNSVFSIGEYAFSGCSSLTSIELPNSVIYINRYAFADCGSLTSLEIPHSVTSIGLYAFTNCSSLTSVEIPNSVTSIDGGAFAGCTSLKEINVEEGNPKYKSYEGILYDVLLTELIEYPSGLSEVNIPNSVTSIGDDAFSGCSSLKSVEIPNRITSIGRAAFASCSSLTSVEIPNSVTSIGNYAFEKCSSLILVELPNSVTSIDGRLFSECSSLTSVVIPHSVTSIGGYAFADCISLTSIEIPNLVTSIDNSTFNGCTSLKNINIEDGNLEYKSYEGVLYNESLTELKICPEGLSEISIPCSVTSIGNAAFHKCTTMRKIYSYAEVPPTCDYYALGVSRENCTLYVPEGSIDAYRMAPLWGEFMHIEKIRDNFEDGVSEVFEGEAAGECRIYDLQGKLVLTAESADCVKQLPAGVYVVKVGDSAAKVLVR